MIEGRRSVRVSAGGDAPIWSFTPEGRNPGLLIVPAIFGVDEGTKVLARRFADAGLLVWVVDPFWRTGGGVCGFDERGVARARARGRGFDIDGGVADLVDIVGALRVHPRCSGRVGTLGVCFGGKFSVLLAAAGGIDAGAAFHGGGLGKLLPLAPRVTVPLSLHFGDQDGSIPLEEVDAIRSVFADSPEVQVVLHAGVGHGFGHPGSPRYDAATCDAASMAVIALMATLRG